MAFERLSLTVAAVSVLGLAACQAPLPNQTSDQTRQAAVTGAAIGAVAGALTGDNREERIERAVIGGLAAGAIGAGIGAALDRQEAELRAQLGSGTITNTGQQLIVTLPNDVLFGFDSAAVSVQSQRDLQAVAASLNRYPNSIVNVIGHTDRVGSAAYNQNLSEQRARSVANVLIGAGVAANRINIIGRGFSQPTGRGDAADRRVEIVITPQG